MIQRDQITVDDDFLSIDIDEHFLSSRSSHKINAEAERVSFNQSDIDSFLEGINYFLTHRAELEKLAKEKISQYYATAILPKKDSYEDVFGVSLNDSLSPEEICNLIQPTNIYIDLGNPCSNIGMSFSCYWDPEHGLGIKFRSLEETRVGTADVAFTN